MNLDIDCELLDIYIYFLVLYSVNASVATIYTNINSILMLNDINFKIWEENIMIVLSCMDLDLALQVNWPLILTDESSPYDKRDWEK